MTKDITAGRHGRTSRPDITAKGGAVISHPTNRWDCCFIGVNPPGPGSLPQPAYPDSYGGPLPSDCPGESPKLS
jgi:hypothetical protein